MRSRARGRWDRIVFFALAIGGIAGALWISYRFDLRPAETAVSLLPSLAGLWLSWAAFRAERAGAAVPPGPVEIADQLALAVRNQWDTEVRMRRMNDPYPLAVSWRAADADLGEAWPELLATADGLPSGPDGTRPVPDGARPVPDGTRPGPGGRAAGPADLAGAGAEITEVFLDRLPTRRLLVLGGPGTGKTVLLIRLLLALIERRAAGGAVPVLFPLASWNPARQPLDDWMAERLARDYTGLGDGQLGHARTLLEHRLILPVLDGFDEIPQRFRGMALDALNAALPLGQALVLSSRVTEYRDALAPSSGVPVRLAGAAAVELQPLDADDIAAYLRRDAGGRGTPAADRWEPVIRRLRTGAPVAQVLRTPLMLFLARTVYNPRPDEHTAALPSPAELCDPVRFPDRAALESHLFDAFVPAAYRPHPRHPCRWSPRQAERALRFLARRLQEAPGGTTDLAWWHLPRALPPRAAQAATGAVLGTAAWFAATAVGRLIALVAGVDSGWLTGPPAAIVGGLAGGVAGGIGCGLAAGLTTGIAEGVTLVVATGAPGWLLTTTANGLAYGFAGGVVGALSSRLVTLRPARWAWSWDWRGGAVGLAAGGVLWFSFRPAFGASAALLGAAANGTVYALAGGTVGALARNLSAHRPKPIPTIRTQWTWCWPGFSIGLASGSTIGLTHWAVLRIQSGATGVPTYSFALMLAFIGAYGLAVGFVHGLKGKPADLATAVGPAALLAQDRRVCRRQWLMVGTAVGCAFLACYAAGYALDQGSFYGLTRGVTDRAKVTMTPAHLLSRALAYGTAVGLGAALSHSAWWHYTLARHHLALRHGLPRDLTAFLVDAHERRGVLRQVGAVHQFRHIELQHRLAAGDPSGGATGLLPVLPGPRPPAPARTGRRRRRR